jgi:hypothetical protein
MVGIVSSITQNTIQVQHEKVAILYKLRKTKKIELVK